MEKKKPTVLPGLVNIDTKPKVLAGIKKAADDFTSSALPIMKYFSNVKPSRNERIIKPDMTLGGKVTNQDLPIIREVLKPGFSGNFRTNYTPPSGPSGLDADAQAYIDAAGITDQTEIDAVNQLVKDLKGTGSTTNNTDLWTGLDAIYPMSPTSLEAARYNLKDTASYKITWHNSPTHATTGVSGNGSDMYGDTKFNVSTEFTSGIDLGITYSGEYSVGDVPIGLISGTERLMVLTTGGERRYFGNTGSSEISITDTTRGIYTGVSRAADDREFYANGISGGTAATSKAITLPSLNLFVLGRNNAGSPDLLFNGECDFWAMHNALTDNQAQDLNDAISTYNTNVISGGR